MSNTWKYTGEPIELMGLYQLRLSDGQTFEIADDDLAEKFATEFANDPRFTSSRTKSPDLVTGQIPVQQPSEPAPAA